MTDIGWRTFESLAHFLQQRNGTRAVTVTGVGDDAIEMLLAQRFDSLFTATNLFYSDVFCGQVDDDIVRSDQ